MASILLPIQKKQAYCFAAFLVLYQFLTYIANDMIMPGMLEVVHAFHGDESAVASSLTLYILGGASLQWILGPLSDSIGRRPVMLTGAILFTFMTILIAVSQSMTQFMMARYFEGMGLCFIGVIGYATLQEMFSDMDAIRLIAILSNLASLAPLLGPLVGAFFISYVSWRWIFGVIGGFSLLALWGLWRYMPEPVGATKIDGDIIPRASFKPRLIFSRYYELLCTPTFLFGALACGLLASPFILWIAFSPIILMTDAKLSVIQYGLWQLPIFGAEILGNWILFRLTRTSRVQSMMRIGTAVTCVGLVIIFLLPAVYSADFTWLIPGLCIYGLGSGMVSAPLTRYVLFETAITKGTASAMLSMISMIVQGVAVEIANLLGLAHSIIGTGLFCMGTGVLFLLCVVVCLRTGSVR